MKHLNIILFVCCVANSISAQNYKINFAGTGASNIVDSVKVENLTQNTSTILWGGDTLNFSVTTGLYNLDLINENELNIYPNPMTEYSNIEFESPVSDDVRIEIYDISGKKINQIQNNLPQGSHSYRISGIRSGIYFIRVISNSYAYSGKLLSNCQAVNDANITYQMQNTQSENLIITKNASIEAKSSNSNIQMQYNDGDILKITGYSGKCQTVFMIEPDSSQTITFNFVECTDGDGNNYSVVQIGDQIWMAENLNYVANPGSMVYDNDSNNAKVYGRLYEWETACNVCPEGWHLPSLREWRELGDYIKHNGNFMKETGTVHWASPNDYATNETGFTALPAGIYNPSQETFEDLGKVTYFWSSTLRPEAVTGGYCYYLIQNSDLLFDGVGNNTSGLSVRCIKDSTVATEKSVISGKLFDSETNEAISDAYITFDDRTNTTSSSDGTFKAQITNGNRLISVFAENYMVFSGLIEVSEDTEFNIPLEYASGLGVSGLLTGNVNSESSSQITVHSGGFYVQTDENGDYSLRLPVGENTVYAIDETGMSDLTEVSISENTTTSVDLTPYQADCNFTNNDNFIVQMTSLVKCDGIYKLGHTYYGLSQYGSRNISCIEKMVYEFSDGSLYTTIYPDQEAINYDDYGTLLFWIKCQPLFGDTITANVYFNDGSIISQEILHPGYYITGFSYGDKFREFPLQHHYCNYEGDTTGENEVTISATSWGETETYNGQLETGYYCTYSDGVGMALSSTDERFMVYLAIDFESVPDGDFSFISEDNNDIDCDVEFYLDDEGGWDFDEETWSIMVKRTGDAWEIEIEYEETDDDGIYSFTLTYTGTMIHDCDYTLFQ